MKMTEFARLLDDGIRPVIEFKPPIESYDDYAEAGMRARVLQGFESKGLLKLKMDFGEFESFNLSLEKSIYYDDKGVARLTAHEAGFYKPVDTYYFEEVDDTDTFFNISEATSLKLYRIYQQDRHGSQSYVQWLEERLADKSCLNIGR